MASETKVGLLAGLAFIICFAVILANRGQTQNHVTNTVATPTHDSAYLTQGVPKRGRQRMPAGESNRDQLNMRNATVPSSQAMQPDQPVSNPNRVADSADDSGPSAAGSEIEWTRNVGGGDTVPSGGQGSKAANAAWRQESTTSTAGTALAAQDNGNSSTTALEQLLNRKTSAGDSEIANQDSPVALSKRSPRVASSDAGTYNVQPGDTLTAISRRLMGSSERRHLDAILDANRAVLSDPDMLKVGMTLVIPHRADPTHGSYGDQRRIDTDAKLVVDRRTRPAEIRWYQVRPNDRYARIAREQLGDAARWQELYELNKDKFPDPDRIREGVRIKLPPR